MLPDNSMLFLDGNRGQYIPQVFAQCIDRSCVTGISEEEYRTLEAGPDYAVYWDTWCNVTDRAVITDPSDGQQYHLYQDDDLWLVPVGAEWEEC